MWLVKAAFRNPYAATVAALLFLVAGVATVGIPGLFPGQIPVDILPTFKSPGVLVMTFYAGMPASAVERNITFRMERWCSQATGVNRVESKTMVGVSIVRLYFRDDIDPAAALTEVSSLAQNTLPYLPPGTLPPVVRPFDPTATLPLSIFSVSCENEELSETELQDLARVELRNHLNGLPGVVTPTVFGGRERTIMVYVDPNKMEVRQISPLDVVRALRKHNVMLTAGTAKFGDEEVQLESNAMVRTIDELNEIPIRVMQDKQVFLKDIGEAKDASAIQTSVVRIDGKPQVYVPVYRQQGASSLAVVDAVRKDLPLLKARSPEGVELDLVMDQSVYVRQAIHALIHEAVLGAVLVALMILVFLGDFRSTVIATMSIPLAVLVAIAALMATGNTINAMTLGGLALAVGPLVDDAIVMLENTHRHMQLGKSPRQAAEDGPCEVSQAAQVATTSTIIVLVPLAFMAGMGRFLFRPLALAVAFAMLASLFLAQTFVPTRCAAWLKPHSHDDGHGGGWFRRFHRGVDRFLVGLSRRYQGLLEIVLRHRGKFLVCVGVLFLYSLGLLRFIGQEFFPQVDSGQLTIFVRCPTGTKLEATNERLGKFEEFVKSVIPAADLHMIVTEVGVTPNWSAAYTPNSGPQDGVVKIQLTEERSKTSQQYASLLRARFHELQEDDPEFADLRISFDTGGIIAAALNYGATTPIDIQVSGGSLQECYRKAREIRDLVDTVPGAVDVHIHERIDYPQVMIEIDRKKADQMGLDVREVFQTVLTALNSSIQVDRNFWLDPKSGNQYFIAVQYEEKTEHKLEEVRNISIHGRSDEPVKLGTLVSFQRVDAGPAEMSHEKLDSVTSVKVNTEGRDMGSVAADIEAKLRPLRKHLPKGMVVKMSGEYERMQQAFANLGWGLLLAAVLVYLLMVAQFKSYLSPFIIMFAVPLGLIGVLFTLFLTHTTLNVQSLLGVIFMVGIVVANSTLLVDFANRQRALGATVHQAITTAAAIRLRPILMTFLATFLDLLPMALSLSKGGEANAPLARAVVGGLLASTVLTLFVVPTMYTLFNRDPAPEEEADRQDVSQEGGETVPSAPGMVPSA